VDRLLAHKPHQPAHPFCVGGVSRQAQKHLAAGLYRAFIAGRNYGALLGYAHGGTVFFGNWFFICKRPIAA
jgi:hypothetical protein